MVVGVVYYDVSNHYFHIDCFIVAQSEKGFANVPRKPCQTLMWDTIVRSNIRDVLCTKLNITPVVFSYFLFVYSFQKFRHCLAMQRHSPIHE